MAAEGAWYNGYRPEERAAKLKALKRLLASGDVRPPVGPCRICGDPDSPVEYHSEDYASPFSWVSPAVYALCRHCHRAKLHKRFWKPDLWHAFVAHVRRGGYARDLKDAGIKRQVEAARAMIRRGERPSLPPLRPYMAMIGGEWFASLRMDPECLRDPRARPR